MSINIQVIKPKELNSFHQGPEIVAGIHDSPWGPCLISQTEDALCGLIFWDNPSRKEKAIEVLQAFWSKSSICYNEEETAHWMSFAIKSLTEPALDETCTFLLVGTLFQVSVWEALLKIPPRGVCTYQYIANQIGLPKAARAVGGAVGRNPISLLIPCHRVLPKSGGIGGYAWGAQRKQALIDYEVKK